MTTVLVLPNDWESVVARGRTIGVTLGEPAIYCDEDNQEWYVLDDPRIPVEVDEHDNLFVKGYPEIVIDDVILSDLSPKENEDADVYTTIEADATLGRSRT